jgi:hypothetical protein
MTMMSMMILQVANLTPFLVFNFTAEYFGWSLELYVA